MMLKNRFFHPPNPGAPRRAFSHTAFSHRSDPQRTPEGTRLRFSLAAALPDSLFEHPAAIFIGAFCQIPTAYCA
jgi:hypothetical protein